MTMSVERKAFSTIAFECLLKQSDGSKNDFLLYGNRKQPVCG